MSKVRDWFVNTVLRWVTGILFRVDDRELVKLPMSGPIIVVANHINAMEAPVVLSRTWPRPISTVAKVETWDSPILTWLFRVWGGIPIERGEADLDAIRNSLAALSRNRVLVILPEGTRSYNGKLLKGRPGVSLLAVRSNALILPVAYYGGEAFKENFRKLKRTDFKISVGNPFYVDVANTPITKSVRQQIVDEIMYQIAALLPESYRGEYSNFEAATERYLRFPADSCSNLNCNGMECRACTDSA